MYMVSYKTWIFDFLFTCVYFFWNLQICHVSGAEVIKRIKHDAQIVVIEQCGHVVTVDRPNIAGRLVTDFVHNVEGMVIVWFSLHRSKLSSTTLLRKRVILFVLITISDHPEMHCIYVVPYTYETLWISVKSSSKKFPDEFKSLFIVLYSLQYHFWTNPLKLWKYTHVHLIFFIVYLYNM